jgi:hypothetical protein
MSGAGLSLLSERQLHLVWRLGLHRRRGLLLEDGRPLDILFPGHPALCGGPDFRDALLRIAGAEVVGDVELHLEPSGWRHHRHSGDSGFAGVVLHVALHRDAFAGRAVPYGGPAAPELTLEPYLELSVAELAAWTGGAESAPGSADPDRILSRLEILGRVRFERRRRALDRVARLVGSEEALYREVMTALGYRRNKAPFGELARLVPRARTLGRARPDLERLYGAVAPNLPWRLHGVRPANHPARRLAGWCALLPQVRGPLAALEAEAIVRGSDGRIGPERAGAIVASAILPARGDWAGFAAMRPPPPDRAMLDACAALGIDPGRVTTMPRRWGAFEWLRSAGEIPESRNRLAPV